MCICRCGWVHVARPGAELWPLAAHLRRCPFRSPPPPLPSWDVPDDGAADDNPTAGDAHGDLGRGCLMSCGDIEPNPGPSGRPGAGKFRMPGPPLPSRPRLSAAAAESPHGVLPWLK